MKICSYPVPHQDLPGLLNRSEIHRPLDGGNKRLRVKSPNLNPVSGFGLNIKASMVSSNPPVARTTGTVPYFKHTSGSIRTVHRGRGPGRYRLRPSAVGRVRQNRSSRRSFTRSFHTLPQAPLIALLSSPSITKPTFILASSSRIAIEDHTPSGGRGERYAEDRPFQKSGLKACLL